MSKFAIAHQMKKKMAKGGSVDEGPSEKENQMGVHKIVPNYDRAHSEIKHGQSEARYGNKAEKHHKVLSELRSMPKPNLKGLAEGGEVDHEADMVHRILKKCYASGGAVANDDQPMVDEEPAQFDYLVKEGGLEDDSSAGNEHGDKAQDEDDSDIVSRVMKSRGKKDRMPRPA